MSFGDCHFIHGFCCPIGGSRIGDFQHSGRIYFLEELGFIRLLAMEAMESLIPFMREMN